MSIIIPSKLSNLIYGLTDDVSALVGSSISSVTPILQRNEAPFFPDYTDHGIQHINNVLKTCELIISEDAWNIFTREDSATLILAAIAHDLGMLINTESFNLLVSPNNVATVEPGDISWYKLWNDFRLATRRFDGATLTNLLGSPEPVPLDELNPDNFTERGLKIAGEFLRRHHHRLSHEIIVLGIPSKQGSIQLFDETPKHFREIAGIIARSHGMPIRNCIELLDSFDRTAFREYRHIHPIFLMALVRLADYLDLDDGRAPSSILAAKSLKSPLSRREWWAHKAMVDCHSQVDDPECLHVVVEPTMLPNVSTFLSIEEKIEGVQHEFDASWAIIGEVYGRFPPLNRLALKIRRIRSDIRNKNVIRQLPFIPYKASLESSKSDLLKLLIVPLYGDNPEIGIRELLQNSVDAVRELKYSMQSNQDLISEIKEDTDGDVVIKFDEDKDGNSWVIVNDHGIGMTWETICNYYLNAGASFRQSDAWKKKYTSESGESQVLRSGRFGIGILAAFLLGDIVQVSTRYINEPEEKGIFFQFGLDDTTIEMKWINRKPGTTIKVKISKDVIQKLLETNRYSVLIWDWFCLTEPKVLRFDNKGKLLDQEHKLPSAKSEIPFNTHKIHVSGYEEIHWSYNKRIPGLVCNGILINTNSYNSISIRPLFKGNDKDKNSYEYLSLKNPNVSVFDPNGHLPLNLARDGLAAQPHNLANAIADDVCKSFIAFCLIKGPKSRLLSEQQFTVYQIPHYPGCSSYGSNKVSSFFFDTNDGFGLVDPWSINFFTKEPVLLVRGKENRNDIINTVSFESAKYYKLIYGTSSDNTLGNFDWWHRGLADHYQQNKNSFLRNCKVNGVRCIMPSTWHKRFIEKQPKYITRSIKIESESKEWIVWTHGKCPDSKIFLYSLAANIAQNKLSIESLTECYTSPGSKKIIPGRIANMWSEVIGSPIIPFDEQKRNKIIETLDKSFSMHIEEWRKK